MTLQDPIDQKISESNSFGGSNDQDLNEPMESDSIGYDLPDDFDTEVELAQTPAEIPEPTLAPAPTAKAEPDTATPDPVPVEEDDDSPTQNRVPVKRLNKEIDKRRDAEKLWSDSQTEMATLRQQLADAQSKPQPQTQAPAAPVVASPDITARMRDILNQTLDGDIDTSAAAMAEIFTQIQADAVAQANKHATETFDSRATYQSREQLLLGEADKLVKEYDVFNEQSENFDSGVAEETRELRDVFINAGHEPHVALRRAADMVIKMHGYDKPAAVPEPVNTSVRKPTQKNIEAAATTPPKQNGLLDTDRRLPSIEEMSETEFDNLTDAELSKLRGDYDF
jgi:hypothetical protein